MTILRGILKGEILGLSAWFVKEKEVSRMMSRLLA